MRFAVLGGDRRSAILSGMLLKDGHKVISFAMEKAELSCRIPRAGCLQSAVYGADCVILPVPAEKGGFLNAPFSSETLAMRELIASLWRGQILCGGKLSDESCFLAVEAGLQVEDLMKRPEFLVGNAALTAEGAVEKLMAAGEKSLWKARVLICGCGRIGKILLHRLKGMGAETAICARKSRDRAMAAALGAEALDFSELEGRIGGFDFIVNTVPEQVITKAMLCCCESGCIILELASAPGGFDKNLAENIGLKVLSAPGLPGSCAPYTGAELIKEAVYKAISEQEE